MKANEEQVDEELRVIKPFTSALLHDSKIS
jgi:hypothetical protein